jgi:hypothetical protein
MTALHNSLRCFTSPWTLGSIVLLLLNDHYLKWIAPSTLTGKLSDVAGLFFFPYLLIVILSLGLDPLGIPKNRTAGLAFGITIVWFILIKIWPGANEFTVSCLARATGRPVQIVCDPTDILALVVLWPAWRLWDDQNRRPFPKSPGVPSFLVLGLASLATIATSWVSPAIVTSLALDGEVVYAALGNLNYGFRNGYAMSTDWGRSWFYAQDIPDDITEQLSQPVQLHRSICVPEDPGICYLISGELRVMASQDGGRTWQIVFQPPPGRRRFMEFYHRNRSNPTLRVFEPGPYDLLVGPAQQRGHTLIVAMGSDGVLLRTFEGEWERVAVLEARPTPYRIQSSDLGSLFSVTLIEWLTFFFAAMGVFWGLSIWGWRFLDSQDPSLRNWQSNTSKTLARLAIIFLLLALVIGLYFVFLLPPVLAFLIIFLPLSRWQYIIKNYQNRAMANALRNKCLFTAIGIFPVAWLPFSLWAFGVIPYHGMALILSLIIAATVFVYGISCVSREIQKEPYVIDSNE